MEKKGARVLAAGANRIPGEERGRHNTQPWAGVESILGLCFANIEVAITATEREQLCT